MSCAVGDRVGAIQRADEATVWLFGFGVYEGEKPAPVGPMGISLADWCKETGTSEYLNPRIALDGGGHVYGLECWWGGEAEVRRSIGDRAVVVVAPTVVAVPAQDPPGGGNG